MNGKYNLSRDHESTGIQKLSVNKCICQKNCGYFLEKGAS